ncbi:MAG TPA: multidrug effflux MFS transporter [Rhodocyclaceae bacterium]|nr:multidrug effflux MFS transporter [Rhodocyclaceae bacterium]
MNTPSPSLRGVAALLAALAALGPFSIDTYLPSFPEMATSLGASPVEIQQTLTAYLGAFAFMTLWHGALSDSFGRRRVILVGLAVYTLASLACAFATRIEHLWLLRGLQGISAGAGMVVGRALVRDIYEGASAQKVMAHVGMMFALAPAVAPVIGGWLQVAFGWRSVFLFLALLGLGLFLLSWRVLPETLPPEKRHPLAAGHLARGYARVAGDARFLVWCGAFALMFGGFFIYVLSAPVFLMRHLGRGETEFLWLFGPAMAGMMAGSWLSGRIAGHWSAAKTLATAFAILGAGAALNVAVSLTLPPGVPWSIVHLAIYNFGMALAMPTLTLLALDRFPERRGMAASCQSFIQTGVNALYASLLVPLLWGSVLTLAQGMAGLAILAAAGAALGFRLQCSNRIRKEMP